MPGEDYESPRGKGGNEGYDGSTSSDIRKQFDSFRREHGLGDTPQRKETGEEGPEGRCLFRNQGEACRH